MKTTILLFLTSVFYCWWTGLAFLSTNAFTSYANTKTHQYATTTFVSVEKPEMMKRHGKVESYPQNRRSFFLNTIITTSILFSIPSVGTAASPRLDVNNALAREYTAFPGLYPTIATKLVNAAKEEPFKNKKEVYKVLNEIEQDRLKQYDSAIVINPIDKKLQQFKTSQICKYECGGRSSSAYRDEQIKGIQNERY